MDFQKIFGKNSWRCGNSGLPAFFSDKRQAGI